ncbi:MAG: DNA mismatch repair endonuclease MutL, partial [Desulfobulbales bacterium]
RHATSKLRESAAAKGTLTTINSLGFRGEAIPSIGSVAKMAITTRTENDVLGTHIEMRYGKVVKVHDMGCPKGTTVEIKDLLGNLPARKKFLKSPRTELFHIEEIIKNYSLANYRLGITYTVNNNRVLDFGANTDTLETRVRKLYAKNSAIPLIPLQEPAAQVAGSDGILVTGFLLAPDQAFAASARLRLFVNGRAVQDRMMAHGVAEGLSGYLMKGRSAAGVVFINVPFAEVDVNVHPTKQEIRFQEPNHIHDKIVAAVRLGMNNYQQISRHAIFGRNLETKPAITEEVYREKQAEQAAPAPSPPRSVPPREIPGLYGSPTPPARPVTSFSPQNPFVPEQHVPEITAAEPAAPFSRKTGPDIPVPESLKLIGQFMDLYLICEARSNDENYLVVIDQHAVHERIIFENLKKQFAARQMTSQNLLFPRMLELKPEYSAILEKRSEQIRQLGIVVEDFGGGAYIIKAVPAIISHLDPEETLTGILQEFSGPEYGQEGGKKRADATRFEDILATMACKAAIKAGQNLHNLEMQELLKLMQESSAFTHCPHGRPVVRMFSADDIKKWFHRT